MADKKISIFYASSGSIIEANNDTPTPNHGGLDMSKGCPLSGDPEACLSILDIEVPKEKRAELARLLRKDLEKDPRGWAKDCFIRVDEKLRVFIRDDQGEEELTFQNHIKGKALFILLLKHSEGLSKQEIKKYRNELLEIYKDITNRWDKDAIEDVITNLLDRYISDTIKNINRCLNGYPNVNVKKSDDKRFFITIPRENIKFF